MFGDHTETVSLLKECGGDLSIDTKVTYTCIHTYIHTFIHVYMYIYI